MQRTSAMSSQRRSSTTSLQTTSKPSYLLQFWGPTLFTYQEALWRVACTIACTLHRMYSSSHAHFTGVLFKLVHSACKNLLLCVQAEWAIHGVPGAGGEVAAHGECRAQGIVRADAAAQGRSHPQHLAHLPAGGGRRPRRHHHALRWHPGRLRRHRPLQVLLPTPLSLPLH